MKKNQPLNMSRRHLMRHLASYIGASGGVYMGLSAISAMLSPAFSTESLTLTPASEGLPDMLFGSDDGDFSLSSLADRPLLINFWATWCAPCVVELPMLEEAAHLLAADNIAVVLISMDRGGAEIARPFLEARDISTPLSLYDPKAEMARAIGLRGLPTTLLVKKNQAEYAAHTGPAEWNDKAVLDQLRAYLID